jgi:CheY-like chemotaxis protein
LRQIIFNLINNAFKFTVEGCVEIDVKYIKQNNLLAVSVKDTGIGIENSNLEKLFKPFSQADTSTTRIYGGTGLGLAISQKLARMLGGDLVATSTTGIGSTFELTVCAGEIDHLVDQFETPCIAPTTETKPATQLQGKVLIADDSPDVQNLLRILISKSGADVTIVENGVQAIECALKDHFDLILMDWQMPVLDGVNATARLRQAGYDSPIVALSASTMKSERQIFLNAGANQVLAKPVNMKTLDQTLVQYLKSGDAAQTG